MVDTFPTRLSNNDPIFEWNEETAKLFTVAFVRNNVNRAIPEISSIVYYYLRDILFDYHINNYKYSKIKYLSNNSILCNFKSNNRRIKLKHWDSTIIFAPYVHFRFI